MAKLITEQHNGTCGHCQTNVPSTATTCTGCGATWGLNNGFSRQAQWNQFIGYWWFFRLFMWAGISLMGYAVYEYLEHDKYKLGAGLAGITIYFMMGSKKLEFGQQLRIAKKGKVSWWRKQ